MSNTIRLECTNGSHNKFYEFVGIENKGRFNVKGLYGRIGQAPNEAIIYDGNVKADAQHEYEKKLKEKQKKGYAVVSANGKAVKPGTAEKKTLQMFP